MDGEESIRGRPRGEEVTRKVYASESDFHRRQFPDEGCRGQRWERIRGAREGAEVAAERMRCRRCGEERSVSEGAVSEGSEGRERPPRRTGPGA